ncbi:hypothetical protein EX30DRAFT_338585 [Ascodesmis nigricans]|uniref:Uncharacterized protein n=1 Tax=Ascodesmis nigricans TaxID=341454 RepID=A0A4S2N4K1_9PEZI|nr:hypothetical protein EX30DRAFT_338585 [Ascodesmis nigricans]
MARLTRPKPAYHPNTYYDPDRSNSNHRDDSPPPLQFFATCPDDPDRMPCPTARDVSRSPHPTTVGMLRYPHIGSPEIYDRESLPVRHMSVKHVSRMHSSRQGDRRSRKQDNWRDYSSWSSGNNSSSSRRSEREEEEEAMRPHTIIPVIFRALSFVLAAFILLFAVKKRMEVGGMVLLVVTLVLTELVVFLCLADTRKPVRLLWMVKLRPRMVETVRLIMMGITTLWFVVLFGVTIAMLAKR